MKVLGLALCVAVALSCAARGAARQPIVVEVESWGTYEGPDPARIDAVEARTWRASWTLVSRGGEVGCHLGSGFGVTYSLRVDSREPVLTRAQIEWRHPDILAPHGELTSTRFSRQVAVPSGGERAFRQDLWSFDSLSDLVPGRYELAIEIESGPTIRRSFEVEGCP